MAHVYHIITGRSFIELERGFNRASNATYEAESILMPFLDAAQEGDAPANVISNRQHIFDVATDRGEPNILDGEGAPDTLWETRRLYEMFTHGDRPK
jgi:hypothetical protein